MSISKISIITVSYNAADVIEKTILSVINQTYIDIEYIIIDGGSTDGTVDIIKKYENRISYWVSEPDKGIYNAMNKGVSKAAGLYCNFMNAGDYFYNNNVLKDIFHQNRTEDILTGITITSSNKGIPVTEDKISLFYFYKTGLGHQASFIKTELLREFPYDENLKIVADSKFFIETLVLNNKSYSPIYTKVCYYDTTGISSNMYENKKEIDKVYNDLFPERIIRDLKLFDNYYNPLYRFMLPIVTSSLFQNYIFQIAKKIRALFKIIFR